MNNIATSLAQQTPPPAMLPPSDKSTSFVKAMVKPKGESFPTTPVPDRSALRGQATQWIHKALETAKSVNSKEHTEECDVGCAVATHNLGEFAEAEGRIAEAKKLYNEAKGLFQKLQHQEGISNAQAGLNRLKKLAA